PAGTDCDNLLRHFSVQMQRRSHSLILQEPPKPTDLIRRLEKRVIAVDGCVLSFNDIVNFVDHCGCDIPNSLDMLGNEQEMVGIDVTVLDEATSLLRAATGIVRVYQTTLVVHEVVEVTAGTAQALAEVLGTHLQYLAADRIADAENLAERKDEPLLPVQAEQHPHRA